MTNMTHDAADELGAIILKGCLCKSRYRPGVLTDTMASLQARED